MNPAVDCKLTLMKYLAREQSKNQYLHNFTEIKNALNLLLFNVHDKKVLEYLCCILLVYERFICLQKNPERSVQYLCKYLSAYSKIQSFFPVKICDVAQRYSCLQL